MWLVNKNLVVRPEGIPTRLFERVESGISRGYGAKSGDTAAGTVILLLFSVWRGWVGTGKEHNDGRFSTPVVP